MAMSATKYRRSWLPSFNRVRKSRRNNLKEIREGTPLSIPLFGSPPGTTVTPPYKEPYESVTGVPSDSSVDAFAQPLRVVELG